MILVFQEVLVHHPAVQSTMVVRLPDLLVRLVVMIVSVLLSPAVAVPPVLILQLDIVVLSR